MNIDGESVILLTTLFILLLSYAIHVAVADYEFAPKAWYRILDYDVVVKVLTQSMVKVVIHFKILYKYNYFVYLLAFYKVVRGSRYGLHFEFWKTQS